MATSENEIRPSPAGDNIDIPDPPPTAALPPQIIPPNQRQQPSKPSKVTKQRCLQNPKSYVYPIAIAAAYSIILVSSEWNSHCTGISSSFQWQYYLLSSILIFILYQCYLFCIVLSSHFRSKLYSNPMFALFVRTILGNALLPLFWCIYGVIDWSFMIKHIPSCDHLHVLYGYGTTVMVYFIVFLTLNVQFCVLGIGIYRVQKEQIDHIRVKTTNYTLNDDQDQDGSTEMITTLRIPDNNKLSNFVEELTYFDALDFSRSNLNGSISEIIRRPNSSVTTDTTRSYRRNPLPSVQQIDEDRSSLPTDSEVIESRVNAMDHGNYGIAEVAPSPSPLDLAPSPIAPSPYSTAGDNGNGNANGNGINGGNESDTGNNEMTQSVRSSKQIKTPSRARLATNRSRSFSNMFLGEVREMSSTMFLNYRERNDLCCVICLKEFKKNDIIGRLLCHHIFHKQCIATWLRSNTTCPLCREDVAKFANVKFL